jgi:hypothetical protein
MAIKISDSVQIQFPDEMTGIQKQMSPEEYSKVAMVVATKALTGLTNFANPNGLGMIQNVAVGTTLVASEMLLTIAGQIYRFQFRLVTTRAMAAAEVFSDAIKWIDVMSQTGEIDSEVARIIRQHLLRELQIRFR